MSDDFDIMDGLGDVEQAAAGNSGKRLNWGKLGLRLRRTRKGAKRDSSGQIVEVSKAEYDAALSNGATAKDFSSEYVLTVGVEEFGSQYGYERALNVKGPDMVRTFMPSVKRAMGNEAAAEREALTWLASQVGQYVEVEDVPQVGFDGEPVGPVLNGTPTPIADGGKVYYAPRLNEVLTRDVAEQRYKARWGGSAAASGASTNGAGWVPAAYSGKSAKWAKSKPMVLSEVKPGMDAAQLAGLAEVWDLTPDELTRVISEQGA